MSPALGLRLASYCGSRGETRQIRPHRTAQRGARCLEIRERFNKSCVDFSPPKAARAPRWVRLGTTVTDMDKRMLWGYAHGRPGAWEAICVDLDIAVQGDSFDEVRSLLTEAVTTYVEDAMKEEPQDARRLLNRRAPFWSQVKFAAVFLAHISSRNRQQRECKAGFDILCPA
jgi:hypothetical protein